MFFMDWLKLYLVDQGIISSNKGLIALACVLKLSISILICKILGSPNCGLDTVGWYSG
uniref:Uncharacterized protein n=1 Tax=Rhizophora mucronata TaxID=61149 RepID=A0A2P2PZY3_RHIMU